VGWVGFVVCVGGRWSFGSMSGMGYRCGLMWTWDVGCGIQAMTDGSLRLVKVTAL